MYNEKLSEKVYCLCRFLLQLPTFRYSLISGKDTVFGLVFIPLPDSVKKIELTVM